MLTVSSLLADCGLELVAGHDGAGREIRWVHISELEDPTRWLSGGELLLTTGLQIDSPERQRRSVERLAGAGVSGLGIGTGIAHDSVPPALAEAAGAAGLPLFEVPYEMPFIAITEVAFKRLVNERYDVLEQGTKVHERLERLVIEGAGLDQVVESIATVVGGAAVVIDETGAELAGHRHRAGEPGETGERGEPGESGEPEDPGEPVFEALAAGLAALRNGRLPRTEAAELPALAGRSLVVPVPGGTGGSPSAWLAVASDEDRLGDFEALIARQASLVVGLELMRGRAVRETERRLAGNLLAEALGGRLEPAEISRRLRPFGVGTEAIVVALQAGDPLALEPLVEAALGDAGVSAVVAATGDSGRPLLCAITGSSGRDPLAVARIARDAARTRDPATRAGVSRPVGVGFLRRAFHEARCALEATSLLEPADAPDIASYRDLGAFTLLLALQDDEALRLYSDGLLDPIAERDGEYGGELLRSLEAFIEQNGNWERAARELDCHRHTLRYRIRRIEQLTGRDLGRATDRIELWLALRARELVR